MDIALSEYLIFFCPSTNILIHFSHTNALPLCGTCNSIISLQNIVYKKGWTSNILYKSHNPIHRMLYQH